MIHTARRRKREERRKKIGLNPKVNLNDGPTERPENSEKTTKFNQDEKLDLEMSSYSNIFCSTLLAIDKNFSGSMAAVGEILSVLFRKKTYIVSYDIGFKKDLYQSSCCDFFSARIVIVAYDRRLDFPQLFTDKYRTISNLTEFMSLHFR